MGDEILGTYDTEDFLDDVVEFSRGKIDEVDFLQKPQRRMLWDRLIRELEKERDEL
jgi:hypothetical protein